MPFFRIRRDFTVFHFIPFLTLFFTPLQIYYLFRCLPLTYQFYFFSLYLVIITVFILFLFVNFLLDFLFFVYFYNLKVVAGLRRLTEMTS
jgi:hypothetical protein